MSIARIAHFQPGSVALPRFVPRHGARSGGRPFGCAQVRLLNTADDPSRFAGLSDELKLFTGTFVAGFLFVSLLIA